MDDSRCKLTSAVLRAGVFVFPLAEVFQQVPDQFIHHMDSSAVDVQDDPASVKLKLVKQILSSSKKHLVL